MMDTAIAMPTAFRPRGGKAPDVVVSDPASASVAARARRWIGKMMTKTVKVGGGGGGGGGGDGDSPPADRSPLKCGTYLIMHSLMTGYFVRSVNHVTQPHGGRTWGVV